MAAGLWYTSVLLPALLAGPTLLLYLLGVDMDEITDFVIVIGGALIGIALWLVVAYLVRGRATAATANQAVSDELIPRRTLLGERIADWQNAAGDGAGAATREALAVNEAQRCVDWLTGALAEGPGVGWASGRGYVAAWKYVHRAEEAMLLVAEDGRIIAEAENDIQRCEGSRVKSQRALVAQNTKAIKTLTSKPKDVVARWGVRRIRRALNEYTDVRAEELVRLRTQTQTLQAILGLAAIIMLALAILTTQRIGLVESLVAFFLVGVVAGLLQTAFVEQRRRRATEDFGVASSRLALAPLLSGIAAVAGVMLVALLGGHPLGLDLLDAEHVDFRQLTAERYPAAFVVAAVFGLTPELLLTRLRAIGDQFQIDIDSAEALESKDGDG